jgi:hypothetical protein
LNGFLAWHDRPFPTTHSLEEGAEESKRDELVDRQPRGADEGTKEPAVELTVLRDRERRRRAGTSHHDVAPLPPRDAPTGALESANGLGARDDRKRRHARPLDGYFDDLETRPGDLGTTFLLHLEPALDRLANVRDRLLPRPSLARTSRKRRTLGHEVPVLAGIDEDLHGHCGHRNPGDRGTTSTRLQKGAEPWLIPIPLGL